ncbi:hypothetical protein TREMEDRAFT_59534 [Tremella mesenterica DSM 1558]|uniref:uncharacterized protein n=1 Tax=Tremella mesenterica (strain ATCC 24925 / CBS 8224 / DSM 1558 / NBRC 9311 / NRRL Y-6157 / RJB 2259-6 / UBC 559-6) TaxID=578456 RepID=UPI0003F4A479|nr:uncharacterized protein TREMEDRAFT_59534 [Tremella mesenterica DSM 1558]EIW73369.1 hypothetical protein TREMEDRAFT_59534 [Tremella mesenterica DSM 1558]
MESELGENEKTGLVLAFGSRGLVGTVWNTKGVCSRQRVEFVMKDGETPGLNAWFNALETLFDRLSSIQPLASIDFVSGTTPSYPLHLPATYADTLTQLHPSQPLSVYASRFSLNPTILTQGADREVGDEFRVGQIDCGEITPDIPDQRANHPSEEVRQDPTCESGGKKVTPGWFMCGLFTQTSGKAMDRDLILSGLEGGGDDEDRGSPGDVVGRSGRYWRERWGLDCDVLIFTPEILASHLSSQAGPEDAFIYFSQKDYLIFRLDPHMTSKVSKTKTIIVPSLESGGDDLVVFPYANGDKMRRSMKDRYCNSKWKQFDQLVNVVLPGGSLGFDNKVFTFPFLESCQINLSRVIISGKPAESIALPCVLSDILNLPVYHSLSADPTLGTILTTNSTVDLSSLLQNFIPLDKSSSVHNTTNTSLSTSTSSSQSNPSLILATPTSPTNPRKTVRHGKRESPRSQNHSRSGSITLSVLKEEEEEATPRVRMGEIDLETPPSSPETISGGMSSYIPSTLFNQNTSQFSPEPSSKRKKENMLSSQFVNPKTPEIRKRDKREGNQTSTENRSMEREEENKNALAQMDKQEGVEVDEERWKLRHIANPSWGSLIYDGMLLEFCRLQDQIQRRLINFHPSSPNHLTQQMNPNWKLRSIPFPTSDPNSIPCPNTGFRLDHPHTNFDPRLHPIPHLGPVPISVHDHRSEFELGIGSDLNPDHGHSSGHEQGIDHGHSFGHGHTFGHGSYTHPDSSQRINYGPEINYGYEITYDSERREYRPENTSSSFRSGGYQHVFGSNRGGENGRNRRNRGRGYISFDQIRGR